MGSADETVAQRIAARVTSLPDALPTDVATRAKQCVLDQLGVQVRGSTLPVVAPALRLVQGLRARAESTVVLQGFRTCAPYAAYANAAFGHSCELDDAHVRCGHPGACVIPAALAVAESTGSTGCALLRAVVAGYEAMILALAPIHQRTLDLGWHGMRVGGVFGAAAAAGSLLGLSADETTHALAIAASEAGGTMEYDQSGGEVKRLHGAMAARSGVQAALLAADGMTGPVTIFEGPRGIYRLFGGGSDLTSDPASRTACAEFGVLDTMFKLRPLVGTSLSAMDALDALVARDGFAADDVEQVSVGLSQFAVTKAAAIRHPQDVIGAQTSLPFAIGLRLVRGRADLTSLADPQNWRDAHILRLADRVDVNTTLFPDDFPELGAVLRVELRDGRTLEARQRAFRGHHENPASGEDLAEKFHSLTDGLLSPEVSRDLVARVDEIEVLASVERITELLAPGAS
jgi:2-methylcitrate dehydratase PrpD